MTPIPDSSIVEPSPAKDASRPLKAVALRGGAYIVVRQGLGMVLSLIGVLFVTRVIGPANYGVFAASFGIVGFVATVGTWGIDVYLIRKPEVVEKREYNIGFTLLLAISGVFVVSIISGRALICNAIHIAQASPILTLLAFYIPSNLLSLPGVVQLDRELRFRRVAYNELASQVLNYSVAVPLALRGAGAWAPAVGMLTQQGSLLAFTYIATSFRPRLTWDSKLVRDMLGYGLSYSSSVWVWQLRTLINPVIVGRFAGVTAVGNVALAIRMTEVLSFAKGATWRVAMAALAKLGESRERLRKSIEEGMRLQALAVGFPLAVFAVLAPFVLLPIFGHRWDPALRVFPFIAIDYLCNSMFNLHASVLYLLRRNMQVTWFHATHVAVFISSCLILVPRHGIVGYGIASLIAILPYVLLHRAIAISVGEPNYAAAAIWFVAASVTVLGSTSSSHIRLLLVALLIVPLLVPRERAHMAGYMRLLFIGGMLKD